MAGVFILTVFALLAFGGMLFFYNAVKVGRSRKQKYLQTKINYESLLDQLSENPEDIQLRTEALENGRRYYGYQHPNLVRFVDDVPIDCGMDTSIIENKVQSDLTARVGKGKIL